MKIRLSRSQFVLLLAFKLIKLALLYFLPLKWAISLLVLMVIVALYQKNFRRTA